MYIIRNRNWFFILPAVLIILSIGSVAVFGLRGGVDLSGGSLLEVSYTGEVPMIDEVMTRVGALPLGEIRVQPSGEQGFLVRTHDITNDQKNALVEALSFNGAHEVKEERFTSIGPTIGQELRGRSWIAIALVSLAIVLYITFAFRKVSRPIQSWKYGVIAIVTLLHDIAIPIGLFAYLGEARGAEVDSLFIVALLAILGISINDTIVVFDRIRERLRVNQETRVKEEFEATVGKSINQTITRSINTSMTVIFVLLALFFFGPESTKNFALTLTVGMIAGTYSSIFLASPLLVVWERFSRRSR